MVRLVTITTKSHHWNISEVNSVTYFSKKVKLSLCFNWAPRHVGVLGECTYCSTHSLTSALDGGEWSASRPGRFTRKGRDPGTHWIGGRAVLDAVVKRKIHSPRRESNPRPPFVQPVTQRYTDWPITALHISVTLLSLTPQPSLGLGLLHKIQLNFLQASQQFSFLQGRVVSPTSSPHPGGPGICIYIPQRKGGYPF
jgi:hypothetical protein